MAFRSPLVHTTVLLFLVTTIDSVANCQEAAAPTALEVFQQRIMPIFRSPDPSSCVQCHLSSVDLKDYILPSHENTFASLRDQGLIDVGQPNQSKILTLIRRGDKDQDEAAKRIHRDTRTAEYEAFASWIKACCNDPEMLAIPPLDPSNRSGPPHPDAVIRHARKSRLVDSFVRNIWSQRMRCFPCHTPHELDADDPNHKTPLNNRRELISKLDAELVDRLDIFKETPEATLEYLIQRSRETSQGEWPLINLEQSEKSLLLQKPLSKLPQRGDDGQVGYPSSKDPVSHLGGLKIHADDQSYKSFMAWLEDYAKVVGGEYTAVADLPADNWYPTQRVLRLERVPEVWTVGVPVQLFVHGWVESEQSFTDDPIAFTQGTVTPRHLVNGALFLLGDQGDSDRKSAEAVRPSVDCLSGGRYLVKVYVDRSGVLASTPTALLPAESFVGQVELRQPSWVDGFPKAARVDASQLSRE